MSVSEEESTAKSRDDVEEEDSDDYPEDISNKECAKEELSESKSTNSNDETIEEVHDKLEISQY